MSVHICMYMYALPLQELLGTELLLPGERVGCNGLNECGSSRTPNTNHTARNNGSRSNSYRVAGELLLRRACQQCDLTLRRGVKEGVRVEQGEE